MQAGAMSSDEAADARAQAVRLLLAEVRRIVGDATDPARGQLQRVGALLASLASRTALFPDAHFPAPNEDEDETLYLLAQSDDLSNALYVWRPAPGLATAVHDHSTWAVIAGIEGEEPNVLWQRLDDGTADGRCALEPVSRARIGPGQHIYFGPHDIHSVRIDGEQAIKHLHLYGRSLMDLPERVDYDPRLGTWKKLTDKPIVRPPVVPATALPA